MFDLILGGQDIVSTIRAPHLLVHFHFQNCLKVEDGDGIYKYRYKYRYKGNWVRWQWQSYDNLHLRRMCLKDQNLASLIAQSKEKLKKCGHTRWVLSTFRLFCLPVMGFGLYSSRPASSGHLAFHFLTISPHWYLHIGNNIKFQLLWQYSWLSSPCLTFTFHCVYFVYWIYLPDLSLSLRYAIWSFSVPICIIHLDRCLVSLIQRHLLVLINNKLLHCQ